MNDSVLDKTFIARGELSLARTSNSIPVLVSGNYKLHDSDAVRLKIIPKIDEIPEIFRKPFGWPFSFEGKTEFGEDIWIEYLKIHQISGLNQIVWKGSAVKFVSGNLQEFDPKDTTLLLQISVSPTPILVPEISYMLRPDGTITNDDDRSPTGIKWETSYGEATLIDSYQYLNDQKIGHKKALYRIQDHQIQIHHKPDGNTSFKSILSELESSLHNSLILLSFFGRKRVAWYEAEVNYYGDNFISAFTRIQTWFGYHQDQSIERYHVDLLVVTQKLRDGIFKDLLNNFQSSKFKETIERTIPHILSSYEDGYLESHLGNVYAALESIVGGLSEANKISYSLGSSKFKKLKKELQGLIVTVVEEEETINSIVKKIPELRRRSFLERLLQLVKQYGIDLSLLWPPDTDIEAELHEILRRRNQLIHQGKMDEPSRYFYDFNRIQKLVELWILKLLDCPDDAINKYALWFDAPINKHLHAPIG